MLAHDLTTDKWRSEDVSLENGCDNVTFEHFGLKPLLLNGLSKSGFTRPSPIQLQAIPIGKCGCDVIAQSKSGTGKTCVFVVIALETVIVESHATQVLIVAPTREIATQIGSVIKALSCDMPELVSCTVIGGVKVAEDRDSLKQSHIVVGTPGRVKQLIELNLLETKSIRLFVMDECDKLMDEKFKVQINDIFNALPINKQMVVSSATMTNQLALFLSRYMRTPAFVRLNADSPSLIGVTQYYHITESHHLNHINFDNKIEPLFEILKKIPFAQCLVFSNYQTRARMLCDRLNVNLWPSAFISSEITQNERSNAIAKMKKFKCRVLVSTDLTSRGIDVENINLVINMDIPFDNETYLHRIGRSGRFGTHGLAVTLTSDGREFESLQRMINECKLIIHELPNPIPDNIWNINPSLELFASNRINTVKECENGTKTEPQNIQNVNSVSSKDLLSINVIINEYKSFKSTNIYASNPLLPFVFNDDESDELKVKNSDSIDDSPKLTPKMGKNKMKCNDKVCDDIEHFILNNHNHRNDGVKSKTYVRSINSHYDDASKESRSSVSTHNHHHHKAIDLHQRYLHEGFSVWSKAMFPDPQYLRTPLQYTKWMNDKAILWSYLLNQNQNLHF